MSKRGNFRISETTSMPVSGTSYNLMSGTGSMQGDGIVDFIKSAGKAIGRTNTWLKNTKFISKGANLIGDITGNQLAKTIGSKAEQWGYGPNGELVRIVKTKRQRGQGKSKTKTKTKNKK